MQIRISTEVRISYAYFSPVLQEVSCKEIYQKEGRHKFRMDRETEFLHKMLDTPSDARLQFFEHPLLASFMQYKESDMRYLKIVHHLLMVIKRSQFKSPPMFLLVSVEYFMHCLDPVYKLLFGNGLRGPPLHELLE